jgi:hypothetical protein
MTVGDIISYALELTTGDCPDSKELTTKQLESWIRSVFIKDVRGVFIKDNMGKVNIKKYRQQSNREHQRTPKSTSLCMKEGTETQTKQAAQNMSEHKTAYQ